MEKSGLIGAQAKRTYGYPSGSAPRRDLGVPLVFEVHGHHGCFNKWGVTLYGIERRSGVDAVHGASGRDEKQGQCIGPACPSEQPRGPLLPS